MVDRIATFTNTKTLNSNNMRVQSEYAKKQEQISSGQISDTYDGIAKDTSNILSLESDYKKTVARSENAQTALDRTEVAFDKLGSIINIGQNFLDDLNAAISGTGVNTTQLIDQASLSLDQVVSMLNSQVAGRYVFSGSAVKTQPVVLANYTGTAPIVLPSVTDLSYYEGNNYKQSVELDEGFTVEYGITADDQAFEKLIRAFDLVKNHQTVTLPTVPDDALKEAYDLMRSALKDIETLKAKNSQDSQTLDAFIDDSLTELNLTDSLIANLKEVDLTEVSVRLQELETQLEASYSVTTTLLNLTLTDYL